MSTEIPFGWHVEEKRFKDPHQVPNGDKCGCICIECKKPLQAAQGAIRQHYFRHKNVSTCSGNLESLMHKVAKQIICDHHDLLDGDSVNFHYDVSVPERRRYGKQPDIYLKNSEIGQSLIVEIFYTHLTELDTLETYINNNERILEIDISCTRAAFFDYVALTALVLRDAPRTFLEGEENIDFDPPASSSQREVARESGPAAPTPNPILQALGWIAAGALFVFALIFFFKNDRKSKHKRRF